MLRIENLHKSYGKYQALRGLNLSIEKGELFGFVGPNGAGKTTTMKIIAGLLKADKGTVIVDDIDALNDNTRLKEKIGYMPDFFGVYDNLKVGEYMEFYSSIYGINGDKAKKLCLELLNLVNLSDKENQYVDSLSRGMKQRLCLARSLVHDPGLLILDEPASGLDPRARFEMKEILKNLCSMGKTIIISSHILPELAEMCSTIGIIDNGTMIVKGSVEDIMRNLTTSNPLVIKIIGDNKKAVQILKDNPFVENIAMRGQNLAVIFRGDPTMESKLLYELIQGGVRITSFAREEGNLESLFMQITTQKEGGRTVEMESHL